MKQRRFAVIIGILVLTAGSAVARISVQGARAQPPDGALEASGRIEGEEVLVNSKIGGRVERLLVREGERVERAQLVAVLNADELDARARQADAQVETVRAQTTRAEGEVRVLESQLAQVRTAVVLAGAQVSAQQRQAQASLEAALARLAQAQKASTMARVQVPTAVDEARAALRATEADLARARAFKEEAAREVARLKTLQAAGAVAAAQVDAARTQFDVAAAQAEATGEQVQRARAALARAEAGTLEIQVREDDVRAAAAEIEGARGQVALAAAGALEVARLREQARGVTQQVDIARAGLAAAKAQLQAAVAARDELQTVRNETRVIAPISGVVTSRIVNPGEVVAPGTPLLIVVDPQGLWLKVFVPGPQIGRLKLGATARVSIDAFPGRAFRARVVEISQKAEFTPRDVQTKEERVKQVFAVKLALDNRDGVFKPGMPADALIFWKGDSLP